METESFDRILNTETLERLSPIRKTHGNAVGKNDFSIRVIISQ
jgi:hypothetical protein